jgi:hypothetical protein
MSYDEFVNNLKDEDVQQFQEDVETWKAMTPGEKAAKIQEVKESGDDDSRIYLLQVNEAAISESGETPGTEAGGASDQSGKEIDPTSKGGEPKEATDMSDDDPKMSDKSKLASAAGIGAGLGALNIAKKLRRESAKGSEVVAAGGESPSS